MQVKIYLASSWRNAFQPAVLQLLRGAGHEVYDFRNPAPGNKGFAWSEIDPTWQAWSAKDYVRLLNHPLAEKGFANDFNAMKWCDVIVLLLPCGRSAHLEAGWGCGAGKGVFVLTRDGEEPELMAKMATGIATSNDELLEMLSHYELELVVGAEDLDAPPPEWRWDDRIELGPASTQLINQD